MCYVECHVGDKLCRISDQLNTILKKERHVNIKNYYINRIIKKMHKIYRVQNSNIILTANPPFNATTLVMILSDHTP